MGAWSKGTLLPCQALGERVQYLSLNNAVSWAPGGFLSMFHLHTMECDNCTRSLLHIGVQTRFIEANGQFLTVSANDVDFNTIDGTTVTTLSA